MNFSAYGKPMGISRRFFAKTMLVMKLIAVFLFVACLQVSANTNAQNVTLSGKNLSLEKVFKEIKKQTGYDFWYENRLLQQTGKITIELKNAPLENALETCLRNQPLSWSIVGKIIVLKQKDPVINTAQPPPPPVEIRGSVKNENGEGIANASVMVKGTTIGVKSSETGEFYLSVDNANNITLVISSIGYETREVKLSSAERIDVVLKVKSTTTDEIVVIGYGTVRKSDLTGSVSSVSRKDLTSYPVTDAVMGLQGKTTGVSVLQNSGAPGASVSVRIRGGNSLLGGNEPLYVVDGFPLSQAPNNINPNDIESIEVLKDASATAIYGSRGANGVVMITTRQGKAGRAAVTFDTYYGVQKVTKTIDMMNAKEFAQLANERAANDGVPAFFTPDQINSFGEGTNWQDLLFRTAPMQNHAVTVTGGNEQTQYAVSGNYLGQQGVIKNSGISRESIRANINQKISDKFSISFNATLTNSDINKIDSFGQKGGTVLSAVLVAPPTVSPFDANGNYSPVRIYPFSPNELRNPLAMAEERSDKINTKYVLAGTAVTYSPIKSLVLRSSFGIESNTSREDIYSSRVLDNTPTGQGSISGVDWTNILNENTATWSKQINENNNLTVLGGFTFQQYKFKAFGTGNVTGFPLDQLETNNLASGSVPGTPFSGANKWTILSYLGRINYSFKNTYLLTASIRADGSSRFGDNHKWGYFPSAAFAWKASNEAFVKNISAISDLKFRVSWGVTGSTAVDPFQTLNTLTSYRTAFNDQLYIGYAPNNANLANPDLKWETTTQFDAGFDLGVIQNRLYFTFDYYHKKTKDLLANSPLATSTGFTTVVKNIGKIQNAGVEFGVSAKVLNGPFKWDLNANISKNKSKVLQLAGGSDVFGVTIPQPLAVAVNLVRVGEPVGVFYGFLEDGLDDNGAIKYKDLDGVPGITNADRTIIGDPNPDFFYNIGSGMSYRNFELNVLFQGVQGADLFNVNTTAVGNSFYFGENQLKEVFDNHWTPSKPDPNAKYPKISAKTLFRESNRYVEDGSFIRLKNIQLAYNFPVSLLGAKWIKNFQLYVSGQNLWTSTSYSWYDPEINTRGGANSISNGIDNAGYPNVKMYTFGARLTL